MAADGTRERNVYTMRDILVSEALMAAVGAAIIVLRRQTGFAHLSASWPLQLGSGLLAGAAVGIVCATIVRTTALAGPVARALDILAGVKPGIVQFLVIGAVAGIGEELLFRAALQSWLGILWASALFALAHAGTAKLDDGVTLSKVGYGAFALMAGVILGLAYARFGLVPVMCAHAAYDATMLIGLRPLLLPSMQPTAA